MKLETRIFSTATELRAKSDFCLEGYAASFGVLSQDLGGFREQIAPGAFTRTLKEGRDVKALLNHDANHILGRLKNGSLKLEQDARGLKFRVALDPKNAAHRDLYSLVKSGTLDECSFAFSVPANGQVWDEATDESGKRFSRRILRDVNIHDISVVTNAAYSADGATSVQARAAGCMTPDEVRQARLRAATESIDADLRRRADALGKVIAAENKE